MKKIHLNTLTVEEVIKCLKNEYVDNAEKSIKYYEKELSNAKGYWYKLHMKIALKKEREWLKKLKQDD